MQTYKIEEFIEELKKNDKDLLMEILLYLQKNHSNSLDALLLNLSDNDNYELLMKIFSYLISQDNYLNLLPEICSYDLREEKNFHLLEECIESDKLPLPQRNALYWISVSLSTRFKEINFSNQHRTYSSLHKSAEETLDLSPLKEFNIEIDEKRVFIYINQYYFQEHAPTIIANLWADTFRELDYKVIIVSTTTSKFAYPTNVSYKYGKLLEVGESKELRDGIFLIEIGGNLTKDDIYIKLIEAVHINKNDKFLLVGDSCLAFDILPFEHKYVVPTVTPKDFILTTALTYIFNRKTTLTNILNQELHYIQGPDDYTQSEDVDFSPPVIQRDNIINIAIIGNRLESDLNTNFWSHIDTLIQKNKNIMLHLIGNIKEEHIPQAHMKNIVIAGFQEKLSSYLENMDFFLNPDRQGGGHSAAIALKTGLPIITLAKGDVYEIILQKYSIETLDEISIFIDNYSNDKNFKDYIDKNNQDIINRFNNSNTIMLNIAKTILEL